MDVKFFLTMVAPADIVAFDDWRDKEQQKDEWQGIANEILLIELYMTNTVLIVIISKAQQRRLVHIQEARDCVRTLSSSSFAAQSPFNAQNKS